MRFFQVEQRRYARFETIGDHSALAYAYSTRPEDVSARTDAAAPARAERRARMANDLNLDAARLCHCVQVHQTRIGIVRAADGPTPFDGYDGLTTALQGVPLMTFSADCPLILAYDAAARVVGMVHASWRCTVATATRILVETMRREFNCRSADMFAGVGPSAGPQSYEVKDDVYEAAAALGDRDELFLRRDGRMYFDLWEANRRQLLDAGVQNDRIEIAGIDTMQATDTFYSFRREGAGCGHFGLMAGIRSDP